MLGTSHSPVGRDGLEGVIFFVSVIGTKRADAISLNG